MEQVVQDIPVPFDIESLYVNIQFIIPEQVLQFSEQILQVRVVLSPQNPPGQTSKQLEPFKNAFSEQEIQSLGEVLHLLQLGLQARQILPSVSPIR